LPHANRIGIAMHGFALKCELKLKWPY
jgi:hypothetical protein